MNKLLTKLWTTWCKCIHIFRQTYGSFRAVSGQFQGKKKEQKLIYSNSQTKFTKNFQKNSQQKINLATQNILSHCISSILRLW